ncbi:hypothetical protein MMC26_007809 [Xylographa opegraphella]|nr:hypothetical protein [Xylographa opegraphella]
MPDLLDYGSHLRRDTDAFRSFHTEKECRFVYDAVDKCAFVRDNCPDEEAGLFSYLQFYYCLLPHVKPLAFTIMVLWLGLLFSTIGIAASDFFCVNLSTIATILGMSESMAGVTFLALGNGSPDVFSTFAAMSTNSGSLAVGELIGAAGFITAVVAGSMALVRPFRVARKSFVRDVGFFVVAASFSMVFLADGHLHLWECGRQRLKADREQLVRATFVGADEEVSRMAGDIDHRIGRGRCVSSRTTVDNFAALETGSSPFDVKADEEADDDTRDRWMAEISRNMRVIRPAVGERHNTGNPIRPSLVGALEFRAILSSLNKSRNHRTIPIGLRRYSDDPAFTLTQQQQNISTQHMSSTRQPPENIHHVIANDLGHIVVEGERSTRARAVSANDAAGLSLDPDGVYRSSLPQISQLGPTPSGSATLQIPGLSTSNVSETRPCVAELHPRLGIDYISNSEQNLESSFEHYSPAGDKIGAASDPCFGPAIGTQDGVDIQEIFTDPLLPTPRPQHRQHGSALLSREIISTSPARSLPPYRDDPNASLSPTPSIRQVLPSINSQSVLDRTAGPDTAPKHLRWWPYKFLPAPNVLASTLCPTIYSWSDKSIGEKFLAVIAAPSVFLLAVTLPVVECNQMDEDPVTVAADSRLRSSNATNVPSQPNIPTINPPTSPGAGFANHFSNYQNSSILSRGSQDQGCASPTLREHDEVHGQGMTDLLPNRLHLTHSPDASSQELGPFGIDGFSGATESPSLSKDWNRWLVCTQLFTAPLFVGAIVWANLDASLSLRNLLISSLYILFGSLLAVSLVLLTTNGRHPPKNRVLLCFVGFIVSIAWISTIANEVVGVLKAFGVIFGISDAILGLTVFAVGNSLGDLVADVTVARLGYPVMALSACFGGPMLNILLGIGLSGLYMTIRDGNRKHTQHPGRPLKYKPYEVEVDGTLLTSGITLLVTLVGLLIVVPLNKWVVDRRIGWGLIALWCLSTIGNVGVEVSGWGQGSNIA